jgi:hypothetical protein
MKLSELKLGSKAKIKWIGSSVDYFFKGTVEINKEGSIWLTDGEGSGYVIGPLYDNKWEVILLND